MGITEENIKEILKDISEYGITNFKFNIMFEPEIINTIKVDGDWIELDVGDKLCDLYIPNYQQTWTTNNHQFKNPFKVTSIEFIKDAKDIKELNDTIGLMKSDNYKDRFKAEYYQLKIRYKELKQRIVESGTNGYMNIQLNIMEQYLGILKQRSIIEGVELE